MTSHDTSKTESPTHDLGMRKGEEFAGPIQQRRTRMADDATGINPQDRGPIDPRMPNLPPA